MERLARLVMHQRRIVSAIGRALLVPALVSLFGRWNWWLPAGLARILMVEPSPLPRGCSQHPRTSPRTLLWADPRNSEAAAPTADLAYDKQIT
jgi:hypothetical protein